MKEKNIMLSKEQKTELEELARHDRRAHVRLKARAVLSIGRGMTRILVADVLGVERRAVGRWVQGYLIEGTSCFSIKSGRGRKARVQGEEVGEYLRQTPRHFGIDRTRWTLSTLRQVTPSLKGMSESGVWRVLVRLGYRYKRGQPVSHSPDPEYREKRGLYCRL